MIGTARHDELRFRSTDERQRNPWRHEDRAGVLFLMTGVMKLTVPMLWNAFDIQRTEAGIPSKDFNLWAVPLIETAGAGLLAAGYLARLGAAMVPAPGPDTRATRGA